MADFLFGLFCMIAGVVWTAAVLADNPSPSLIGKDRADLLLMKAECERNLTRDKQCIARIEFVPE